MPRSTRSGRMRHMAGSKNGTRLWPNPCLMRLITWDEERVDPKGYMGEWEVMLA